MAAGVFMPPFSIKTGDVFWTPTSPAILVGSERTARATFYTGSSQEAKVEAMLTPTLRDSIGLEIGAAVPEVEVVFSSVESGTCYVWTVVTESNPGVRRNIYVKEKSLIDRFPNLAFEFNIIASRGQDPMSVIGDPALELAFRR